jgi:hydroxymethylglutaryl-CoA lyase
MKNYGQQSPTHALEKMETLLQFFGKHGLQFNTLTLSMAWGDVEEASGEDQTLSYTGRLLETAQQKGYTVQTLTLADTAGCATPERLASLIKKVKTTWPDIRVGVHLHPEPENTEASIHACLEGGVHYWEAAWGGVGGSPFASGAGGNLDIRWLIKVYRQRGLEHGFNLEEIDPALDFLRKHTGRSIPEIPW